MRYRKVNILNIEDMGRGDATVIFNFGFSADRSLGLSPQSWTSLVLLLDVFSLQTFIIIYCPSL